MQIEPLRASRLWRRPDSWKRLGVFCAALNGAQATVEAIFFDQTALVGCLEQLFSHLLFVEWPKPPRTIWHAKALL
jgi:hypothetical protein